MKNEPWLEDTVNLLHALCRAQVEGDPVPGQPPSAGSELAAFRWQAIRVLANLVRSALEAQGARRYATAADHTVEVVEYQGQRRLRLQVSEVML